MNTLPRGLDRKRFIKPEFDQEMTELFNHSKIVPFSILFLESEPLSLTDKAKQSRSIIQLGFVVSDKNDKILLTKRTQFSRDSEAGHAITVGHSLMIGWSPVDMPVGRYYPASEEDILWAYRKEVNDDTLQPPRLRFLGLVMNQIKGITYYFYVFNVKYSENAPVIPRLKKDEDDEISGFQKLDANLLEKIKSKKADLRALQLMHPDQMKCCDFGESRVIPFKFGAIPPFLIHTPDVFISHAEKDNAVCNELVAHLKQAGLTYWVDHLTLEVSDEWFHHIKAAVKYCKIFAILCSKDTAAAGGVQMEVAQVLERRCLHHNFPIVPVALDGAKVHEHVPEIIAAIIHAEDMRKPEDKLSKWPKVVNKIQELISGYHQNN